MVAVDALDTEAALVDVILNLGQSKQVLAREVTAWTLRAPWLEAGITLAKIAQDELGHAQILTQMHADRASGDRSRAARVGLKGEITHSAVRPFAARTESWQDFIALMCLWDSAVASVLETLAASNLSPLQNAVSKMCKDEEHHWIFAYSSARELLARDGQVPEAFTQAANALTPKVQRWFDAVGDLGRLGGRGGPAAETEMTPLTRYEDRVGPFLEEWNVSWPASGGGR